MERGYGWRRKEREGPGAQAGTSSLCQCIPHPLTSSVPAASPLLSSALPDSHQGVTPTPMMGNCWWHSSTEDSSHAAFGVLSHSQSF